jgi:hypothetical protein
MRLFTDHDELLSMVIFHEEPLDIHTTTSRSVSMQHPNKNPSVTILTDAVSCTIRTTEPPADEQAFMPVSFQKLLFLFSQRLQIATVALNAQNASTADAIPMRRAHVQSFGSDETLRSEDRGDGFIATMNPNRFGSIWIHLDFLKQSLQI